MLEELLRRETHPSAGKTGDDLDRLNRIAAEREEVVVDADALYA